MATAPLIPLAEYFERTYHPDREFIDGESAWFVNHEAVCEVLTYTGQRMQVSPTRVRVPDLTNVRPGPQPDIFTDPPLLIVGILSRNVSVQRSAVTALMGIGSLVLLVAVFALSGTPRSVPPSSADRVLVEKSAHRLTLLRNGIPLKTYRIALGRGGLTAKTQAGDDRVPEGLYRITSHNEHSAYYRALRIGYPTPDQALLAKTHGVNPGGDIMIHGIRNGLGWLGPL